MDYLLISGSSFEIKRDGLVVSPPRTHTKGAPPKLQGNYGPCGACTHNENHVDSGSESSTTLPREEVGGNPTRRYKLH